MFNKLFKKSKGMAPAPVLVPKPTKKTFTISDALFERAMGYVEQRDKLSRELRAAKEAYVETGIVPGVEDDSKWKANVGFKYFEGKMNERIKANNDLMGEIAVEILRDLRMKNNLAGINAFNNDSTVKGALYCKEREVELTVWEKMDA